MLQGAQRFANGTATDVELGCQFQFVDAFACRNDAGEYELFDARARGFAEMSVLDVEGFGWSFHIVDNYV